MKLVRMTLLTAWRALRRNLTRSVLTMLGVVIGVAAVIAMVSVGQGADASVQAQIARRTMLAASTRAGPKATGSRRCRTYSAAANATNVDATFIVRVVAFAQA